MRPSVRVVALVSVIGLGNSLVSALQVQQADVILGGLFTSTLLNLFIVPALYLRYGRSALATAEETV